MGSLDHLVGELAAEVSTNTKRNRVRRVTTTWRLTAESYAVRRLCAAAANGDKVPSLTYPRPDPDPQL